MKSIDKSAKEKKGCLLFFLGELFIWWLIPVMCIGAFIGFDVLPNSNPNWLIAAFVLPFARLSCLLWQRQKKASAQATLEASPPTAEDDITPTSTGPKP